METIIFRGYLFMLVLGSVGAGNSNILGIFTPNPGGMIQFDYIIFFNWGGSTTNYLKYFVSQWEIA